MDSTTFLHICENWNSLHKSGFMIMKFIRFKIADIAILSPTVLEWKEYYTGMRFFIKLCFRYK